MRLVSIYALGSGSIIVRYLLILVRQLKLVGNLFQVFFVFLRSFLDFLIPSGWENQCVPL